MADVKNIFKYSYLLYQKYHGMENTDANWLILKQEAVDIVHRYKSKHAENIVFEVMKQIDRECKGKDD